MLRTAVAPARPRAHSALRSLAGFRKICSSGTLPLGRLRPDFCTARRLARRQEYDMADSAKDGGNLDWFYSELGWFVSSWWPGIILCIVGSVLMNWGTNVMKLAINLRLATDPRERKRLIQTPQWVVGFALFAFGTIINFVSFKFAAQSLLSGLSSVQFISQLFFSKVVLHERVDMYSYLGVVLILAGSFLLVYFGQHETKNYGPEELAALYGRTPYVCYILLTSALSCAAWVFYERIKRRIRTHSSSSSAADAKFQISMASMREVHLLAAMYAVRAGIWGAYSVTLAKSLSMLLIQLLQPNRDHTNPLVMPETYFIIMAFVASAMYRIMRLNQALKMFDAVYMVPMLNINWILFASVGGGIYYDEFATWGVKEFMAYTVAFGTIIGGVLLLCPREDHMQPVTQAEALYDLFQPGSDDEDDVSSVDLGRSPLTGGNGHRRQSVTADDDSFEGWSDVNAAQVESQNGDIALHAK
ncbi:putative magnesium transporter NIPA8 [Porphyridium purpureum]|uniref:Putative magnesium transporter NIPA8 n=1 Tax=Porphyridium purpureum TaxID=35688 RepID=A0A5J4YLH4_PORPP|nr:putative magnesium transporter NIPA8 [Porphyridium purpureum]|eukprot:POR4211..scf210_14